MGFTIIARGPRERKHGRKRPAAVLNEAGIRRSLRGRRRCPRRTKRGNYGTKNIRAPADVYAAGALAADPAFGAGAAFACDGGHGRYGDGLHGGRGGGLGHFSCGPGERPAHSNICRAGHGRRRGGKPVSGPAGQGKCLPLRQAAGIRHLRHGGCHRRAGAGAQPAHPSTGVRQCGAGRNAGRRDIFLAFGAVIPDAGAVQRGGGAVPQHGQQPHFAVRISYHERYQHRRQRAAHLWPELGRGGRGHSHAGIPHSGGPDDDAVAAQPGQPHLSGAPVPPGMERRHPQKHPARGRAKRAGKRHVPDRQAAGGGAHHHLRHVGYRGQCHLQQCRFYVQHSRLGHRPGDDHCGGPVRGRKRLSAGAALYENPFGGGLCEYGPAEYRAVPAGAVPGGLLRHAADDHGPCAFCAAGELRCDGAYLAVLVHAAQRAARGGRRQVHDGDEYGVHVGVPHRHVLCAGRVAGHGPVRRLDGHADRLGRAFTGVRRAFSGP